MQSIKDNQDLQSKDYKNTYALYIFIILYSFFKFGNITLSEWE